MIHHFRQSIRQSLISVTPRLKQGGRGLLFALYIVSLLLNPGAMNTSPVQGVSKNGVCCCGPEMCNAGSCCCCDTSSGCESAEQPKDDSDGNLPVWAQCPCGSGGEQSLITARDHRLVKPPQSFSNEDDSETLHQFAPLQIGLNAFPPPVPPPQSRV